MSIETTYDGIKFRSRLEADIAWAIKNIGHKYEYEKTSFLLPDSGIHYQPDFYVPDIQLWIEGRGYESDKGDAQIKEFAKIISEGRIGKNKIIHESLSNTLLPFEPYIGKDAPDYLVIKFDSVAFYEFMDRFGDPNGDVAVLCSCEYCSRYFIHGGGSFQCRCCGAWDGDMHIKTMAYFKDIFELKEIIANML